MRCFKHALKKGFILIKMYLCLKICVSNEEVLLFYPIAILGLLPCLFYTQLP